ncbi:hypothetical protein [Lysinibacillus sp. SGAir0095]|uniref:hypothetical protein n=1 Tax=Lysinibacillus sp. SGAir0095 TaxID=2070463 RepID=UPI0010CCE95D|nr:hypothetical protein [Lysinibacillus sp. SGAir0095]QCR32317.1 hypothetical protein C1N55_09075 [Lysinibacillus sp. SGAir0095]
MKCRTCNLIALSGFVIAFILLFNKRKSKQGHTLFVSSGIEIDYPVIDIEKQEVTAYITYKEKLYMRVQYNLDTRETKVTGSLEAIKLNPLVKNKFPLKDDEYIEMIKMNAEYLIENEKKNAGILLK